MRILLISNGYPPNRWAGTETYTASIAKGLNARGHQVQVLCVGEWQVGSQYFNGYTDEVYQQIAVRRLNLNWMKAPDPFGYLYNNPIVADHLHKFLDQIQPDIVHVTSCETLSASVLKVVKTARLPSVLSLTDFWFLCPRINLLHGDNNNCDGLTTAWECLRCQLLNSKAYSWPKRFLPEEQISDLLSKVSKIPSITRWNGLRGLVGDMEKRKEFLGQAISWPDVRITASPFVRNLFVKNGVDAPIQVYPYGHDLSWLDSFTGKTHSERLRIGYIGQIVESKGVHLLLQAAESMQEQYGNYFELLIYGNLQHDPDYSAKLRSVSTKIRNIKFCGTYPHDESAAIFANIDVLAVPSLWYDFPLIIHEAFATGTPVVATNLGGMAEAVSHEVSGLLFERGDVNDLIHKLGRFFEEPGLINRLKAGIPTVKKIENEIDELEQVYHQLLDNYIGAKNRKGFINI
jgi:glycosyltransferase involved in cell wall biosynthesis